MKILISGGRVIDPATGRDGVCDVAVAAGRIIAIKPGLGEPGSGFEADRTLDATGCIVAPGLVDLAVRLREPGQEHAGMLESEMAAAVAGGITSLVCPPDTDPVLDEPGLVDMLKHRAEKLHQARVFPLGALTRGLTGEVLTEMVELTEAGCIGFGQAEVPIVNTQVLQRALQYAATFGYTVWLRPQDAWLGKGVAASGPLATRMGLSGVPVMAELIALHTIFELVRSTGARVHLCRLSSAAGIELVRQAKAEGLPVTCDVSVHNLHLIDVDLGYFDSRTRLSPPLRQQRDREALRAALADRVPRLLPSTLAGPWVTVASARCIPTPSACAQRTASDSSSSRAVAPTSASANGSTLASSSTGVWSETSASMVPSARAARRASRSRCWRSGGDKRVRLSK